MLRRWIRTIHRARMRQALRSFYDDELPQARQPTVRRHLSRCPDCDELWRSLAETGRFLTDARPEVRGFSREVSSTLFELAFEQSGLGRRAAARKLPRAAWGLAGAIILSLIVAAPRSPRPASTAWKQPNDSRLASISTGTSSPGTDAASVAGQRLPARTKRALPQANSGRPDLSLEAHQPARFFRRSRRSAGRQRRPGGIGAHLARVSADRRGARVPRMRATRLRHRSRSGRPGLEVASAGAAEEHAPPGTPVGERTTRRHKPSDDQAQPAPTQKRKDVAAEFRPSPLLVTEGKIERTVIVRQVAAETPSTAEVSASYRAWNAPVPPAHSAASTDGERSVLVLMTQNDRILFP